MADDKKELVQEALLLSVLDVQKTRAARDKPARAELRRHEHRGEEQQRGDRRSPVEDPRRNGEAHQVEDIRREGERGRGADQLSGQVRTNGHRLRDDVQKLREKEKGVQWEESGQDQQKWPKKGEGDMPGAVQLLAAAIRRVRDNEDHTHTAAPYVPMGGQTKRLAVLQVVGGSQC